MTPRREPCSSTAWTSGLSMSGGCEKRLAWFRRREDQGVLFSLTSPILLLKLVSLFFLVTCVADENIGVCNFCLLCFVFSFLFSFRFARFLPLFWFLHFDWWLLSLCAGKLGLCFVYFSHCFSSLFFFFCMSASLGQLNLFGRMIQVRRQGI